MTRSRSVARYPAWTRDQQSTERIIKIILGPSGGARKNADSRKRDESKQQPARSIKRIYGGKRNESGCL